MAEPHFIEDDDQEKARIWWKANRLPIISGVVIGLAIIIGTNAWKSYQQSRADAASSLFSQMLERDAAGDHSAATDSGEALIAEYTDTPYAGKAALVLARISYDNKQIDDASERLQWAISDGRQFETINAARLKLASIQFDNGDYQQALDTLSVDDMQGFESHYFELRGDAYARLGQQDNAHDAYRAAIDGLAPGSLYEPVLRMKLESTTSGSSS
jgi:predicted negative regulator of RcsB-dependent stress response